MDTIPTIASALSERTRKPSKTRKQRKPRKARKPRIPKLHRPKKESTKTITTRLYKTWAAIVHAYHNGKCAVCGKEHTPQAPLNAHHIMPRQMFSGLRFDPQNGIALCPKCHKMGKFSAHKGGIWFAEFLRTKYPEKYEHCLKHKDDELDCKDRTKLYTQEVYLHTAFSDAISPLPKYRVEMYTKDGRKVETVVDAYNNRAAEYIAWTNWPASQPVFSEEVKLKGIHRTTEVRTKDLLDRISDHFDGIKFGYYKPVSEMVEPEFVDYLTETFKGRKMDDDTMRQMTSLFDEYCASHGLDPRLYILHGDCHGNVSIAPAVKLEVEIPTNNINNIENNK
jgi:5-methylcytosine-specific restriction endonuclease McrA